MKTDRRDCLKLAGLARAGELEPIYVPDAADEAMRDLVRTREDAVAMQRQARQRLQALLLRNEIRYVGKTAWTEAHRRWIAQLESALAGAADRLRGVRAGGQRGDRAGRAAHAGDRAGARPLALAAGGGGAAGLRGIQLIHAVRIVAELGDLARFGLRAQLMGYLGLIPSEDSSGERRRQGVDHQGGQQLGASRAGRGRVGLSARRRQSVRSSRAGKPGFPRRRSTSPGRRSCACARGFVDSRHAD